MKTKIILLFIFFSCFAGMSSFAQKGMTIIKASDNGKTVTVKKGAKFDALFEAECIGCAGIWKITAINKSNIKLVSSSYGPPSCTNCTGGNHDHVFHFKALKAGTSKLKLEYMDQSFNVTIVVK
ncbi:MAG TPA: protease inhibitor I42 family protein [Ferruginibacter sp.]|nr:protease inhibitor I42 family protein [Ferruginibacter sp.]